MQGAPGSSEVSPQPSHWKWPLEGQIEKTQRPEGVSSLWFGKGCLSSSSLTTPQRAVGARAQWTQAPLVAGRGFPEPELYLCPEIDPSGWALVLGEWGSRGHKVGRG